MTDVRRYHGRVIVRRRADGRTLVDRETLIVETGLSEITIRVHLRRLGTFRYDAKTGRALYDHAEAHELLAAPIANAARRAETRRKAVLAAA